MQKKRGKHKEKHGNARREPIIQWTTKWKANKIEMTEIVNSIYSNEPFWSPSDSVTLSCRCVTVIIDIDNSFKLTSQSDLWSPNSHTVSFTGTIDSYGDGHMHRTTGVYRGHMMAAAIKLCCSSYRRAGHRHSQTVYGNRVLRHSFTNGMISGRLSRDCRHRVVTLTTTNSLKQ